MRITREDTQVRSHFVRTMEMLPVARDTIDTGPLTLVERMALQPVARDTIDEIIEVFSKEVPVIFGDNLALGFICGSVARNTAHHGDDIDTVIVVHSIVDDQVSRFGNWMSELHRKTEMTIDVDFPYELFTVETMHEKFGSLASLRPSLHYVSSATYDTMTWAEMVSNPVKAGIIGDREMLNSQSQRCIDHIQRWREEIRGDLKVSVEGFDCSLITCMMAGRSLRNFGRCREKAIERSRRSTTGRVSRLRSWRENCKAEMRPSSQTSRTVTWRVSTGSTFPFFSWPGRHLYMII